MGDSKTRNILLLGAVVIVAAAGVSLVALSRTVQWTTVSNEALAEFEAGLEASQKLYMQEARAHFELALKLDPDFALAKIKVADLCRGEDAERSKSLLEEALAVDTRRLTVRERFMIDRARLLTEDEYEEAGRRLDAYVEAHEYDPYVLHIQALRAWQQGKLEDAERLNERLLEIDPNWVLAYNQLGYITMMQGRFVEAEEYFTSYRFIAPDQANPHDSLGELFILLGKYEEAEDSLERALAIKPDFAAAFEHLVMVDALRGEWEAAAGRLERREKIGGMNEEHLGESRCGLEFWRLATGRDWQAVFALAEAECNPQKRSDIRGGIHLHQAACYMGDWKLAETIEAGIAKNIADGEGAETSMTFEVLSPVFHHMFGVRRLIQKEFEGAIEELKVADEELTYLNAALGIFKLSNRMVLAAALAQAGRESEAHDLVEKVRAVNPRLAEQFEEQFRADAGL